MNDNNGNSDEIKYCSICHRSEHDTIQEDSLTCRTADTSARTACSR